MTITLPTQTMGYTCPASTCNCDSLDSLVTTLNSYTNQSFTYTLTKLFTNPFATSQYYYPRLQNGRSNDSNSGFLNTTYIYGDKTYPASGGTNFNTTLLPLLSGTTWDWTNHFYITGNDYYQYVYQYEVRGKTPLSSLGFEIWGNTISNFGLGTSTKIYDSSTGIEPGKSSFFV